MEQSNIKYKKRIRPSERRDLWISRIIIWIFLILAIYPIFFIVTASLSKGDAFFSNSLLPKAITFGNYKSLFDGSLGPDLNFTKCLENSLILCTTVCIIQLIMTGTAAYAFSRMRFKGRKYGLMALLLLQMFPGIMTVSAVYIMLYSLQATDNLFALALFIAGGSAFNIWLMKGFMDSIPKELDEAAMIDGASHWQIFTKIIVPLAMPMFAVILLFTFFGAYSEFVFSSAALTDPNNYTVAIALEHFIDNAFNKHWTQFAAAAVVGSLPQVIIFIALQKFLQKGLVAGSIKG
jgi:arabinogalactan oligomer/maltooligosaccharide transport system permease protein